jgi:putative ABC transport system permease protein
VSRRPLGLERPRAGWQALIAVGRRSELAVTAVMIAILAVVAFGAVAAPRLLADAEADSLELAIEQARPSDRRLTVRLIDNFTQGFNRDPLLHQRERVERVADGIDAELLERYGAPRLVADTSRFAVVAVDVTEPPPDAPPDDPVPVTPPALPTFLTFRVHPEIDDHSRLVDGRPAARTEREVNGLEVIEFELTPETADELGWELGEVINLTSDTADLVTRQFDGGLPDDFAAELVGLRELDDEGDPFWADDPRLHRPATADTAVGANVFAFAMITPLQLPVRPFMVDQHSPFSVEQRRDLIVGAVDLDNAEATLDGLVALEASFATQPTLTRPGVNAGLRPALETERDQRRAARATLVLAAVGMFGVVLTTLSQLLLATFDRRRGWLTVARARGASRRQLVTATSIEMSIVVSVATAVGAGAAIWSIGGLRSGLEVPLLIGLVAGTVGAAAMVAWAESARPVNVSARPAAHPGLGRWSRVGGGLLVVVAAAALVTFRRRGLANDAPEVDPLVVLLPVLVPLAIVYLTRWVLPAALRQVSRRGLALGPGRLVGVRRVISSPDASVGLITVLVLALTVSGLGLGINRSLERGAVDASWSVVGAPYRVDSRDASVVDSIRAIPGAVVSLSGSARINVDRDDNTFSVQFITIDAAEIEELTDGTVADENYPADLETLDLSGRVPMVAAERIGGQRVRVGDVYGGVGTRQGQGFVVVQTRSEGFGRRNDWIMVDRTAYAVVAGTEPAFSSVAIGVPDNGRAALDAAVAAAGEDLEVRTDILELQRDDPLSRAVRAGYLLVGLFAVLLAVIAVVAVAVVTARERRREVAILGLLGSGPREISRAVAFELIPGALAGVVTGSIVGWLVVRLYEGRFDLSSFAGGSPVSIRPDPLGALAVGIVLALVAVGVIVVLVRRIVHAPVGEILRIDGAA